MVTINMHEAKTRLSDLVARAEAGEEIVIARRNKPAVRLARVRLQGEPLPPVELEDREHAPDDTISKEDLATYYRRFPQEWDDMIERVGSGESEPSPLDLTGLAEAIERGREFTILQGGKAVATVVPADAASKRVRGFGMLAHLPPVPDGFFLEPLPEEELRAWEGEDATDAEKPGS